MMIDYIKKYFLKLWIKYKIFINKSNNNIVERTVNNELYNLIYKLYFECCNKTSVLYSRSGTFFTEKYPEAEKLFIDKINKSNLVIIIYNYDYDHTLLVGRKNVYKPFVKKIKEGIISVNDIFELSNFDLINEKGLKLIEEREK